MLRRDCRMQKVSKAELAVLKKGLYGHIYSCKTLHRLLTQRSTDVQTVGCSSCCHDGPFLTPYIWYAPSPLPSYAKAHSAIPLSTKRKPTKHTRICHMYLYLSFFCLNQLPRLLCQLSLSNRVFLFSMIHNSLIMTNCSLYLHPGK